jgi:hypothetical protein
MTTDSLVSRNGKTTLPSGSDSETLPTSRSVFQALEKAGVAFRSDLDQLYSDNHGQKG